MRKAIQTNFIFYFLFILMAHVIFMLWHWERPKDEIVVSLDRRDAIQLTDIKVVKKITKQMVQSEDPATKTAPRENARFSDKDRSFDRQTKARNGDSFKESSKDVSLGALGGDQKTRDPFRAAAREYSDLKKGIDRKGFGRRVSSTNDYLEDVPLGDLTHLNTVEHKFYGYYFRIKQKLEGFWGRSVREKAELLASQGRRLAEDEHITALRIIMDTEGEIVDVIVLGSSGVRELDDAAIESFNDAGPFPHPPKDLVVEGRVTIEWGFVVNS